MNRYKLWSIKRLYQELNKLFNEVDKKGFWNNKKKCNYFLIENELKRRVLIRI